MVHVPVVAHANNWNNGSSSSLVSSTNIRLDCETTNYGLSGYPDKWGKSWVPPRYSLVVSGGTVTLSGRNAKGRITRDTAERIEVAFDSAMDTRIDGGHLKGTYFRTNNKFEKTKGCIAILKKDFLKILPVIDKTTKILII